MFYKWLTSILLALIITYFINQNQKTTPLISNILLPLILTIIIVMVFNSYGNHIGFLEGFDTLTDDDNDDNYLKTTGKEEFTLEDIKQIPDKINQTSMKIQDTVSDSLEHTAKHVDNIIDKNIKQPYKKFMNQDIERVEKEGFQINYGNMFGGNEVSNFEEYASY